MLTIEDALLMRAELCDGSITFNDIKDEDYYVNDCFRAIEAVLNRVDAYCDNPDGALWQSLLTREVLLTGGLDAEYEEFHYEPTSADFRCTEG